MNKAYTRTNWKNEPDTDTPLNASNLNNIETGLDEIDNRVVSLDTTKANKTDVATAIVDVSLTPLTGILTFTKQNGTTFTIDTKLEKIVTNWTYDRVSERIILTLDDGSTEFINLSSLVSENEFVDTDTIAFTVEYGTVEANVKRGSITGDYLEPNYLAQVVTQVGYAEGYASQAFSEANSASFYANQAEGYAERAESANNDKLPLSGGMLTGDVGIPVEKSTIDGSIPYAGSNNGISVTNLMNALREYKTYLGSILYNGEWNTIISVRHKNGYDNGNNNGMYIRTVMNTNGSLVWNKQKSSVSWQGERTLLDSSNWNNTITKTSLNLGNVENKSSETIRNEITKANIRKSLGLSVLSLHKDTYAYVTEIDLVTANYGVGGDVIINSNYIITDTQFEIECLYPEEVNSSYLVMAMSRALNNATTIKVTAVCNQGHELSDLYISDPWAFIPDDTSTANVVEVFPTINYRYNDYWSADITVNIPTSQFSSLDYNFFAIPLGNFPLGYKLYINVSVT